MAPAAAGTGPGGTGESAVRVLEEWALRGGHWQVLSSTPGHTSVALLTCDGGEEMERVVVDGPGLHDWLAGRTSSAD